MLIFLTSDENVGETILDKMVWEVFCGFLNHTR